ncbi:hypothetical protein JOF29_007191 [Kribbella aluminosa]|uniref:Uncharacterized protein n=1 Tax=Kribbella aluminosa TaxID=416017 RepID=A0ABS4UX12_9ACTN|nr:hypothetical protein [Kribbella aluminosa]
MNQSIPAMSVSCWIFGAAPLLSTSSSATGNQF